MCVFLYCHYQVASGLAYLHDEHGIVYYDLKSPNILVFQFPSVQYSLQGVHSLQVSWCSLLGMAALMKSILPNIFYNLNAHIIHVMFPG